jgi:hypothetical protein
MYHLSSVIDDAWEHRVITKQHHCVIAHECVGRAHWKSSPEKQIIPQV